MPIDLKHYPPNWQDLALQIKTEANWTCEHCDRLCLKPQETLAEYRQRLRSRLAPIPASEWLETITMAAVTETPQRFRLTVAHLDQNPANNDRANLKALCSICHLHHDRPHRNGNTYRKRERYGQLRLGL